MVGGGNLAYSTSSFQKGMGLRGFRNVCGARAAAGCLAAAACCCSTSRSLADAADSCDGSWAASHDGDMADADAAVGVVEGDAATGAVAGGEDSGDGDTAAGGENSGSGRCGSGGGGSGSGSGSGST